MNRVRLLTVFRVMEAIRLNSITSNGAVSGWFRWRESVVRGDTGLFSCGRDAEIGTIEGFTHVLGYLLAVFQSVHMVHFTDQIVTVKHDTPTIWSVRWLYKVL